MFCAPGHWAPWGLGRLPTANCQLLHAGHEDVPAGCVCVLLTASRCPDILSHSAVRDGPSSPACGSCLMKGKAVQLGKRGVQVQALCSLVADLNLGLAAYPPSHPGLQGQGEIKHTRTSCSALPLAQRT